MSEPTPTPAVPVVPATPLAAAAPSPAVAQRFADPDMVYRANIFGKEEIVPIGVMAKDYQTSKAGREALEQAKRIRAEAHLDTEHAQRWRTLELQLKTSPEQAFAGLERLSGYTRPSATDFSDPAPKVTVDPQTRELADRLSRIESNQNQVFLQGRVKEALDGFEFYRKDPEARGFAEKQILAHMIINPDTDPMDVAREVHSYEMKRASVAATQQRDGRLANQDNLTNVPASVGFPDLSDIPQGKQGDAESGQLKRNILAAMSRFGRQAVGQ